MVMPVVRAVTQQLVLNEPLAVPPGTVLNDLLVAVLVSDNTQQPRSAPAGWVREAGFASAGGGPYVNIYTRIASASEPADYRWTYFVGDNVSSWSDSTAHTMFAVQNGTFDANQPLALLTFNPNSGNTSASVHTHPGLTTTKVDALAFWLFGNQPATSGNQTNGAYALQTAGLTQLGPANGAEADNWLARAIFTEPRPTAGSTGSRQATWRLGTTATARTLWRSLAFVVQGAGAGGAISRTLVDAAAIRDGGATTQLTAQRTHTDAAAITDSAVTRLSMPRTLTDSAAITDSASWLYTHGRTLTDAAAIRDSHSRILVAQRELVDRVATSDHAFWEMSVPEIGDFQFLLLDPKLPGSQPLPRVVLGLGAEIVVTPDGFDPAYGDVTTQDQNSEQGDFKHFGVDRRAPGIWNFEAYTDAPNAEQALGWVDMCAEAWDAEYIRETPGAVMALQYKVAGRTRRIFGRPRNFQAPPGLIRSGRVPLAMQFHRVEDVTYDDDEQVIPIRMGKSGEEFPSPWQFPLVFPTSGKTVAEPRTEQIRIGGRLRTWLVISITGPVVNPWVKIGGRTWALNGEVGPGTTVHLSGLPWMQTVYQEDGTFRPDMLDPRSRLMHLRFEPGQYPATFGGYDTTGTARAEVRWRNAYRGW